MQPLQIWDADKKCKLKQFKYVSELESSIELIGFDPAQWKNISNFFFEAQILASFIFSIFERSKFNWCDNSICSEKFLEIPNILKFLDLKIFNSELPIPELWPVIKIFI